MSYIILGSYTATTIGVSTGFKVMSYMGSSSGMEFLHDYSSFETTTTAIPASYYLVGANFDGGSGFLQWFRTRAYPPNGVMPSVTFGSVQSTAAITLYLNGVSNANTTITYGTESNFTAVISSSTDYVSLYVNGTKVVSLTQGKAVYLKTLADRLSKAVYLVSNEPESTVLEADVLEPYTNLAASWLSYVPISPVEFMMDPYGKVAFMFR